MKYVIAIILNFVFITQSMGANWKWPTFEQLTQAQLASKNTEAIWGGITQQFKTNYDKTQSGLIKKELKKLLPTLKYFKEKNRVKIGGKNFELVLTDFNSKKKTFKINGKTITLNFDKTLDWNIENISQFIKYTETTWFKFSLISKAHAGVLKLVLAAVALLILAIVSNEYQNEYILESLQEHLDNCEAAKNSKAGDHSELLGDIQDQLGGDYYKRFYEKILNGERCIAIIDGIAKQNFDGRTALELTNECSLVEKIIFCTQALKEKKPTTSGPSLNKSNSDNSRPVIAD